MKIENLILDFLKQNSESASGEFQARIPEKKSIATIKRSLSKLKAKRLITSTGKGKATKYKLSPYYNLFREIDIKDYYEKEIDERTIIENFNFSLLTEIFPTTELFTEDELNFLIGLQKRV